MTFSSAFAYDNDSDCRFILNPVLNSEEIIYEGNFANGEAKFLVSLTDTLRNHDNFAGGIFWYNYCSTYVATRLTVPNQVAIQCTIKFIRFWLYRPMEITTNAPCSIFIWRDTIINGIPRPGSRVWGRLYSFVGSAGFPGYIIEFSGAPIIFNRNENFWLGGVNFNRQIYFISDATSNPDQTRNQWRNWGGNWSYNNYDYIFEAAVAYEPRDNNVGPTAIHDVEKLMRGNTITAVKTTVKNFGRNTLAAGIPVIMNITGPSFALIDTEYTTTTLTQGTTELITFSEDWQVPTITGDYIVSVRTAFNLDSIYSNDTMKMTVFVYNSGVRETFEQPDFPPAGWLVFDFNNDNFWRRDASPAAYYTAPAGAIITYDEYPYYPNNDWLVSPRFEAQPSDSIIFFYRAASSARMETLLVRLNFNSTNNDTSSYQIVRRIATNNSNWQKCVIALNSLLSQTDTISLAFHYPSFSKFYIAIDDIITPQSIRSIDVFTRSIETPLLPIIVDSTYLPRAKFRNNSCDNLTEYLVVNMYYAITGNNTSYFDSIIGEQIYHGNYETYEFTSFTPVVSETVEIKVWVYNEQDENSTNDTITKKIFIAPKFQSIPYSTNFNENWGKYGDNPPLGGWRIIDNGNEGNRTWNTNDWHKDTVRYSNVLRNAAKVSYSPVENQEERLISPRFNCSQPGTYMLNYWHWYRDYSQLRPDSGVVLVSNNGGQSWQRIVKYSNVSDVGARVHNISSFVSGHNDVRICFLYGARDEWYWSIDDFSVTWMMNTPVLTYPTYGLETLATTINMNWQSVAGATKYVLQIAYDSTFLFPIVSETLTSNSYSRALPPYRYFWKVKAGEPYGNWSDIWYFTIIEPTPPVFGWQQIDSIIVPLYGYNVKDGGALTYCPVDSNIYAFKGNNTSEFYAYNVNRENWYTKKPIKNDSNKVRHIKKGSALCAGDTLIYAVKGNSNEFWAYYPRTDTWLRKKSIPEKTLKGGSSLVYVRGADKKSSLRFNIKSSSETTIDNFSSSNDLIYLLKGGSKECEFYAYCVNNDTWIRKQNAPKEKHVKIFKDGSALVYNGDSLIYALKGGSKANEFYSYNINKDTWVVLENDTIPQKHPNFTKKKKVKNGGGLAIIDSLIYAIKGGGCIEFWRYNINNRTWTGIETIPWLHKKSVPINGSAITAALGKIYLLKGNNTSEFWCYTPNLTTSVKMSNILSLSDKTQSATNTNITLEQSSNIANPSCLIQPNPCRKSTTIYYTLSKPGFVSIKINDISGRIIKTVLQGVGQVGNHRVSVMLKDIPAGVYFVTFEAGQKFLQTKLVVR